jgi:hypothetical protein
VPIASLAWCHTRAFSSSTFRYATYLVDMVNKYDIDGDSRLYNSSENGEERLDRDGDRDRERDREK